MLSSVSHEDEGETINMTSYITLYNYWFTTLWHR